MKIAIPTVIQIKVVKGVTMMTPTITRTVTKMVINITATTMANLAAEVVRMDSPPPQPMGSSLLQPISPS